MRPVKTLIASGATRLRIAALLGFLWAEATAGAVPIVLGIAALVRANFPAGSACRALRDMPLLHETVLVRINDGPMAVFFLLVGLELRRSRARRSGLLRPPGRVLPRPRGAAWRRRR